MSNGSQGAVAGSLALLPEETHVSGWSFLAVHQEPEQAGVWLPHPRGHIHSTPGQFVEAPRIGVRVHIVNPLACRGVAGWLPPGSWRCLLRRIPGHVLIEAPGPDE